MRSRLLPALAAGAVMFVVAATAAAEDKGQKDLEKAPSVTGKVVRFKDNRLTIKDADGNEHTYTLAADAVCTIDGKKCETSALDKTLKEGQRVRVRPLREASTTAVKVEVLDKNKDFEKSGK